MLLAFAPEIVRKKGRSGDGAGTSYRETAGIKPSRLSAGFEKSDCSCQKERAARKPPALSLVRLARLPAGRPVVRPRRSAKSLRSGREQPFELCLRRYIHTRLRPPLSHEDRSRHSHCPNVERQRPRFQLAPLSPTRPCLQHPEELYSEAVISLAKETLDATRLYSDTGWY
jgi:hypothetical protein